MNLDLKTIRKEYGFTQETMAQLLGTNRSSYANWEGARSSTPPHIEQRIKRLFDIDSVAQAKQLRAERLVQKIAK